MSVLRGEALRIFMVDRFFTPLHGMSLGEWLRLLGRHQFAVDPQYWPRAAFMTLGSALTSAFARYEERVYGPQVRRVSVKAPLFILGHARSGTTFLYSLIANDPQFAYPHLWQVLNPHTFLTTERFSELLSVVAPKKRLSDNVRIHAGSPLEDQFALTGTLRSPLLRWAFPHSAAEYDRYLTFEGVPQAEIEEWKAALLRFYQKLTLKYNRPLLLKSPPHTCRIKLLLEMFPDARFIHIHRHPFAVFQSSRRETEIVSRVTRLQQPAPRDMDTWIIRRYQMIYEAFFAQRELIPAGQFCEVAYEELARDPVGQVGRLYQELALPGFDAFRPTLQGYVDAQGGYRKNRYNELPAEVRERLMQAWRRSFDAWGYTCEET